MNVFIMFRFSDDYWFNVFSLDFVVHFLRGIRFLFGCKNLSFFNR